MLTHDDKQEVKKLISQELKPIHQKLDRLDDNIDKILKIVTDDRQELALTQAKVNSHDKRLLKVEKKVGISSPTSSALA